jgi:hypothetical protein
MAPRGKESTRNFAAAQGGGGDVVLAGGGGTPRGEIRQCLAK